MYSESIKEGISLMMLIAAEFSQDAVVGKLIKVLKFVLYREDPISLERYVFGTLTRSAN
jgi:hypothetical protein